VKKYGFALHLWSTDYIYSKLNKALRDENENELKKFKNYLTVMHQM